VIKVSFGWRGTDIPLHVEHAAARQPPSHICIVSTFYRKHFVSFALPEELADGCRKALAAARGSSWLGVPPNGGPLLRLTSGLDGVNACGQRSDPAKTAGQSEQRAAVGRGQSGEGMTPSRPQVNRSKGPPLGGAKAKEWARQDRRSIGAKGRRWDGPSAFSIAWAPKSPYPVTRVYTVLCTVTEHLTARPVIDEGARGTVSRSIEAASDTWDVDGRLGGGHIL
jgi:hypothetical protein